MGFKQCNNVAMINRLMYVERQHRMMVILRVPVAAQCSLGIGKVCSSSQSKPGFWDPEKSTATGAEEEGTREVLRHKGTPSVHREPAVSDQSRDVSLDSTAIGPPASTSFPMRISR